MIKEDINNFNSEQKEAISFGEGPALILAGPGSGKTLVITWRVRWLIENCGVSPSNILVITFTRAAAEEMKNRFRAFEGMEEAPVSFGTMHSVFFMILRRAYHYHAGQIIQEETKKNVIRGMIESLDLETGDEGDFINGVIGEISFIKGEMIAPEYYHSSFCSDEMFLKIAREYEAYLRREGLIDFDDILAFCYELLKEREDIRKMWQERFAYILIDEFQDINKLQYEIVRLLVGEKENIFVVGDDDQSIYRFRGARPEIMSRFRKDYPQAKQVILSTNYRCSREIVDGALRLIGKNSKRFEKKLHSDRGSKKPVIFASFPNTAAEAIGICEKISDYRNKDIAYEDMAVIFRTNTQPRQLVQRLMERNIPFTMRDVLPDIFSHWIARDLITYLKMAAGDRSRAAFLRIMNRPKRYISRDMIRERQIDFRDLKKQARSKVWLVEKIDDFERDLLTISKMAPYEALTFIRSTIGYEDYIREYAGFRHIDCEPLMEILEQIIESAKDHHSFEEWFDYIQTYREELAARIKAGKKNRKEGITLTTMHQAKGLEFEVVFVIDCNEGVTPHRKAVKEADLEEERRLFYVAMTRAKTWLHLYSVEELYQKEAAISRYIAEVRYDREKLKEGNVIIHKNLGKGRIVHVNEEKIALTFDGSRKVRYFSLKYLLQNGLITFENCDIL